MEIKIRAIDGPARICELLNKNCSIITPNIFFLDIPRFKKPDNTDIFLTSQNIKSIKKNEKLLENYQKTIKDNIKIKISNLKPINDFVDIIYSENDINKLNNKNNLIYIIGDTINLLRKPKEFINLIINIRKKIGYEKLIYLPTIADISNISFFTYLGIDLFDCISSIISARKHNLFFSMGNININDIKQIPCNCKYCKNYIDNPSSMPFKNILNHNYIKLIAGAK